MAIISVQRDKEQKEQKVDPLDRILKGLQIASNIYGIKTASEQSDLNKARLDIANQQQAVAQRQESGVLTPLEAQKAGFTQVPEGTEGAVNLNIKTGENIEPGSFRLASDLTSERALSAAGEKETTRLAERRDDQELKVGEKLIDFQKEKKTKDLSDKYNSAARVEALVELKNPIADAILKRNLFRISGDVGVIRAEDLRELGSDPSLIQKAQLAMDTMLKGEPITDKARIDIKEATSILKAIAEKELNNFGAQRSQAIAGLFRGFDSQDILDRMNLRETFITQQEIDELVGNTMKTRALAAEPQSQPQSQEGGFLGGIKTLFGGFSPPQAGLIPDRAKETDNDFVNRYLSK